MPNPIDPMKRILPLLVLISLAGTECGQTGGDSTAMTTQLDSIAYAVGMDVGTFYHERQGIALSPELFYAGFRDRVQDSSNLRMSDEEAYALIQRFATMMESKRQSDLMALAAENEVKQKEFLESNQNRPEVEVMANGIQYQVLTAGTGASPTGSNVVQVRITGELLDGMRFVDSANEPNGELEVDISQTIPGIAAVLTTMKPGGHWRVWIPSELGWGSDIHNNIPPNSLLIYDIELIEILR